MNDSVHNLWICSIHDFLFISSSEAQWSRGDKYYTGTIVKHSPDFSSYDINYDDGDFEEGLPAEYVRLPGRRSRRISGAKKSTPRARNHTPRTRRGSTRVTARTTVVRSCTSTNTGSPDQPGSTPQDRPRSQKRRLYRCAVCGAPKKGHVCTGNPTSMQEPISSQAATPRPIRSEAAARRSLRNDVTRSQPISSDAMTPRPTSSDAVTPGPIRSDVATNQPISSDAVTPLSTGSDMANPRPIRHDAASPRPIASNAPKARPLRGWTPNTEHHRKKLYGRLKIRRDGRTSRSIPFIYPSHFTPSHIRHRSANDICAQPLHTKGLSGSVTGQSTALQASGVDYAPQKKTTRGITNSPPQKKTTRGITNSPPQKKTTRSITNSPPQKKTTRSITNSPPRKKTTRSITNSPPQKKSRTLQKTTSVLEVCDQNCVIDLT